MRHPGSTDQSSDVVALCEPARPDGEALPFPARLYDDIVAMANDAIIAVDEEQHVLLFNRGAEEIFGYAAVEVVGRPLAMLLPPSTRAVHGEQVRRFGAGAIQSRRMGERGEIAGRRKNGEIFPAEASITRHEIDGRLIYTSILRDTSEPRRREKELRLLRTIALEVGAAEDLQTALCRALEEVGQVTGWATGEAWLPAADGSCFERGPVWTGGDTELDPFHEVSERYTFGRGEGLVGQVWATGQPLWIRDLSTCDGFARRETASAIGLRTAMVIPVLADDEVVASLAFYHFRERREDRELVELVSAVASQLGALVQRKRSEAALAAQARALEEQAAELARSNAELEQFAYVASHDLQEPLRMVASYTQLLARRYGDRLDDDGHEFIGYAVDGVTRMHALIGDLLAFSRVGRRMAEPQPIDLATVLERVRLNLGPMIEESGATLTFDGAPVVLADGVQMEQLFQNLIGNALKFRKEGVPPRVHVSAEPGPDEWMMAVADNGIGIAPQFRERIFAIFQRLHSRTEYPGTGIGLAICRKIVEGHGGRIWVEETAGGGTTFRFALPRGVSEPAPGGAAPRQ